MKNLPKGQKIVLCVALILLLIAVLTASLHTQLIDLVKKPTKLVSIANWTQNSQCDFKKSKLVELGGEQFMYCQVATSLNASAARAICNQLNSRFIQRY